jgi:hypothetical protein
MNLSVVFGSTDTGMSLTAQDMIPQQVSRPKSQSYLIINYSTVLHRDNYFRTANAKSPLMTMVTVLAKGCSRFSIIVGHFSMPNRVIILFHVS